MDRISNNEGTVLSSVLSSLVCKVEDIARLYLFTVLSVDNAIQCRIMSYDSYETMICGESHSENALNRKFREFQPIFLNATTMLHITEMICDLPNDKLRITDKGHKMLSDMLYDEIDISLKIDNVIKKIVSLTSEKDTKTLYNDLNIQL